MGYMYLKMYNDFIDMGALEPLDECFTEEEISNYLYYDLGNARILYFNMDILNEAGVTELPTTWQDLVDVCTQVKEANLEGVIPFAQEWADLAISVP